MFTGWAVALNGVMLTDCAVQADWDELECSVMEVLDVLDGPPEGLDLPGLRDEDQTYYQRDGVKHFSDWYEPRLITVTGRLGPNTCESDDCSTIRQQLQDMVQAWKRSCCDTELVIYPDCFPDPTDVDANRDLNGPFGVVGRPRVFQYQWLNRRDQVVEFTARFDAVDQRMYVLDACGTPGYSECENITPGAEIFSTCFNEDGEMCFPICFTNQTADTVEPVEIVVGGTEKVNPTITLYPPLAPPLVENITTGEWVQLDAPVVDSPVTINTEDGTAFDADGNSLTHLLRGSLFLSMFPGIYSWRLISNQVLDEPGYAQLCWRNSVVSA